MSETEPQLWEALQAPSPVAAMTEIVKSWKSAGVSQAEATERLTLFLERVGSEGSDSQDDLVREVLDLVTGFCSPQASIYEQP